MRHLTQDERECNDEFLRKVFTLEYDGTSTKGVGADMLIDGVNGVEVVRGKIIIYLNGR